MSNEPEKKSYAPLLVPAIIKDAGHTPLSEVGDIVKFGGEGGPLDLKSPPSTNQAYCLVVTNHPHVSDIVQKVKDGVTTGLTRETKGHLMAEKVWNAVWNDYADFQLLNDELIPGKVYFDTADGARICNERCQLSVMGIASDTFAQVVGQRSDIPQIPVAVSGWVLAFVDREYPCGTPLTNDENGNLTEMSLQEKRDYPERLVAIYKRRELDTEFGTESAKIKVNGRHWVKVK